MLAKGASKCVKPTRYKKQTWGTWVAQSVKHLILDCGSAHDLRVHRFEPCIRLCADTAEPAWDSLSPSLSAPPLLALSLPLKINKLKKKKKSRYDPLIATPMTIF